MSATQPGLHASIRPAINPILSGAAPETVLCEGWVLKKRRKKMQGFARRYFTLHHTGLLSYSFGPGQPLRDQIQLSNAAISTAPGRKDIHVDSNTATFHIKCLSIQDFDMWMAAFRKFISAGMEAKRSASIRRATVRGSLHASRTGNLVDEMAVTIHSLEEGITTLLEQVEASRLSRDGNVNSSRRGEKEKHKDKFGGLFKKSHDKESPQQPSEPIELGLHSHIRTALGQLKNQHAALTKLHLTIASPVIPSRMPPVYDAEEAEENHNFIPASAISPASARRFSYPQPSTATSVGSESIHEWYDAMEDGPEEFIMDEQPVRGDHPEQQASLVTNDMGSIIETQGDDSSIDTDFEDAPDPSHPLEMSTYRTQLPVPAPEDEGSLFAILKKNVGKDLSTITFPVTFNEPLSLLQRTAEELEYWDLLNQAAQTEDPADRMAFIAAFAVSGYAHTRHRSGRKGFNPLLAETFEDVRMKLIVEKVRHNPVEMAYHAEGKGWELTGLSAGRTKFWGKSLEIIPSGSTRISIGSDVYVWRKPSSFIRNLMVGTKYFEHTGQMTIENTTTGMRCVLDFKQNGYWGPTNVVAGAVHARDGKVLTRLEGKWDDQMATTQDGDRFHVIWRCLPFPKNTLQYYGFTAFGITLNEITKEFAGKLPSTDSRLRPDIRALEAGDLDTAEAEKSRLEEMQRERRRQGEEAQPRWFKQVGEDWDYSGGYWEARGRNWKAEALPKLW